MRLVNNYDKEISFENLKEAKSYYLPSEEVDKNSRDREYYLGDDFESCLERWDEYISDIKNANSLQELCDVLNRSADEFQDGSMWKVIE